MVSPRGQYLRDRMIACAAGLALCVAGTAVAAPSAHGASPCHVDLSTTGAISIARDAQSGDIVVLDATNSPVCAPVAPTESISISGSVTSASGTIIDIGASVSVTLDNLTATTISGSPVNAVTVHGAGTIASIDLVGTTTLMGGAEGWMWEYAAGIWVDGNSSVVIDGEGKLIASSATGMGVGGENGGFITINGGTIEAKGSGFGAAIGGIGDGFAQFNSPTVRINGGNVTATNSSVGAAIGAGYHGGGTVTITGGRVVADASQGYGAAIGGGSEGPAIVTIAGGRVTATARQGAGIGGGAHNSYANVYISGGVVDARSAQANDIGGQGPRMATANVELCGGSVVASRIGAPDGARCWMGGPTRPVYRNTLTVGDPARVDTPVTGGMLGSLAMNTQQVQPGTRPTSWVYGLYDVVTSAQGTVDMWLPASPTRALVSLSTQDGRYANIFERPSGTEISETLYRAEVPTATNDPQPWWMWEGEDPGPLLVSVSAPSWVCLEDVTALFEIDGAAWGTGVLAQGVDHELLLTVEPIPGLIAGDYKGRLLVSGGTIETGEFPIELTVVGEPIAPIVEVDDAQAVVGDPVALVARTSGESRGDLTYQWQRESGDGGWTNIDGATGATFAPDTQTPGSARYRVVVTATVTFEGESRSETSESEPATVTLSPVDEETPPVAESESPPGGGAPGSGAGAPGVSDSPTVVEALPITGMWSLVAAAVGIGCLLTGATAAWSARRRSR